MGFPKIAKTLRSKPSSFEVRGKTHHMISPVMEFSCTVCGENNWMIHIFNENGIPYQVKRCKGGEYHCDNDKGKWMTNEEAKALREKMYVPYQGGV